MPGVPAGNGTDHARWAAVARDVRADSAQPPADGPAPEDARAFDAARVGTTLAPLSVRRILVLDEGPINLDDVISVARDRVPVEVSPEVLGRVAAAHEVVLDTMRAGIPSYGLNTGLGPARDQRIPADLLEAFQEQIISSHAAGIGEAMGVEEVRAIMFARLAGMSRGGAGTSPSLFEALRQFLNKGVHPVVPRLGSVGSADLAQMASIGTALLGKGRVIDDDGSTRPAADALAEAGLRPVQMQPKDSLALIGANAASVGTGTLNLRRLRRLLGTADHVAALTVEALTAHTSVFADVLMLARPLLGQAASAARIRAALHGSALVDAPMPNSVQDPLSLRTVPQVHGALADLLQHCAGLLTIEINSRAENPLVDVEQRQVISNGNFSVLGIALAFEALRLAVAHMGMLAERRIALLVRNTRSTTSVAEQVRQGRWRTGYLVPVLLQNTAAALVSELKQMASPITIMGTPVADGVEDHNSLAFSAIQLTGRAADHVETLQAIEVLLASDTLDGRGEQPLLGEGTGRMYRKVKDVLAQLAPGMATDVVIDRLRTDLLAETAPPSTRISETPGGRRGRAAAG
ncbi:histidine ammonia-lyase [Murinocardiopsis flavida]|uniref:Histidine ammonia-lyase n=1 Tax=Murinocardiopsis flavida TaxID=645275 RepID=A0A2P8CQY4_9ACTN|nr:aromatic amino acid ammonia-lyase [Murinocardiopsis flavida]PSK87377.1 histidine ammonia-lyase [Murinocardiopsis flavida]